MLAVTTQRVNVVGRGGAGKSTLARQLGCRLGLPVVDLDLLFWRQSAPGLAAAEKRELVADLVRQPRWVCDGDHLPSQALRFAAGDTVIFLDLPRTLCVLRLVRRALRNRCRRRQPGRQDGVALSRWRTLAWVWGYPRAAVDANLRAFAGDGRILTLRRPAEVTALVATLPVAAEISHHGAAG